MKLHANAALSLKGRRDGSHGCGQSACVHYEPIGATPRRLAWGNNWVVAAIVVRLPFLRRPVALPVLFRLQVKREDSKHELAAQLLALIARRYPQRRINVVGDGHYTGPALVCEPNVTLTARLRTNAALHELAPPRTGKRGRLARCEPGCPRWCRS
jgi:hypothetical protein